LVYSFIVYCLVKPSELAALQQFLLKPTSDKAPAFVAVTFTAIETQFCRRGSLSTVAIPNAIASFARSLNSVAANGWLGRIGWGCRATRSRFSARPVGVGSTPSEQPRPLSTAEKFRRENAAAGSFDHRSDKFVLCRLGEGEGMQEGVLECTRVVVAGKRVAGAYIGPGRPFLVFAAKSD
jgi:hypothetical protein